MAQTLTEKELKEIKVCYVKIENGKETKDVKYLVDLTEEEKQNIVSLSILPLPSSMNSNVDVSTFISGFPMLSKLGIPEQFTAISYNVIQKNGCPNLKTILRTKVDGIDNSNTAVILRGGNTVKVNDNPSEEDIKVYAGSLSGLQDLVSIYEINARKPRKTKEKTQDTEKTKQASSANDADKKPQEPEYVTNEVLRKELAKISAKLELIESFVPNKDNVPTLNQIANLLHAYTGKVTVAELSTIMEEILKINLNINVKYLENSIQTAIKNGLETIRTGDNVKNLVLEEVILSLSDIGNSAKEESKKIEEARAILQQSMPRIIANDRAFVDSVYFKLAGMNRRNETPAGIYGKLEDVSAYTDLILNQLQNMGLLFGNTCADMKIDDNSVRFIKSMLGQYAESAIAELSGGNQQLFVDIKNSLKETTAIDSIQSLVKRVVATDSRADIERVMNLSDVIIRAMGNVARLDGSDLGAIENIIRREVNKGMDSVYSALTTMPTRDSYLSMIRNYGYQGNVTNNVNTIFDIARTGGMTNDDLNRFVRSYEGRQLLASAIALDDLNRSMTVRPTTMQNFRDTVQAYSDMYKMGFSAGMGVVGGQTGTPVTNNTTQNNSTQEVVTRTIAELIQQGYLTLGTNNQVQNNNTQTTTISNDGSDKTPTPSVADDLAKKFAEVSANYEKERLDLRAKLEEQAKVIADLQEKLALLQGKTTSEEPKKEEKTEVGTSEPRKPEDPRFEEHREPQDDKKTGDEGKKKEGEGDSKDPKPEVSEGTKGDGKKKPENKNLPVPVIDKKKPKAKKEKLVKGTLERLDKLAERKLPWYKRLGNFVIRHPFRSALIGMGAGALLATGIGTIFGGGLIATLNTANLFLPTIAIGAGIGAGTAGVIDIASKFTSRSKRERLYTEFQKNKKKCDKMAFRELSNEKTMAQLKVNIKKNRQKQKTGNKILKFLGIYNIAKKFDRKVLKILRNHQRKLQKAHVEKVEKSLEVKKKLNALEAKKGKTLAMGGYLQKYRKGKAKFEEKSSVPGISEEKLEDLTEDFNDLVEDIEDEVPGVTDLSENFETFDKEAIDLIAGIKERKTKQMDDYRKSIEARNSKKKLVLTEESSYDEEELKAYVKNAREKKDGLALKEAADMINKFNAYKKLRAKSVTLDELRTTHESIADAIEESGELEIPSDAEIHGVEFEEEKTK